ncbi:MAG: FAD-binding oxidoreductase [Bacteroidetes bacterium]|nr:FAD-binding oxidoreductase [Bacteroidota bacterium]
MSQRERKVDFIIVGQGLAGSCLAIRLMTMGKSVWVIDQPENNRCSKVAAGLFNPITGMGIVKTWMAEEIFEELFRFFSSTEVELGASFFYPMHLYRPFQTVEEQNNWMAKTADKGKNRFVKDVYTSAMYPHIHNLFGGIEVNQSGYLDTNAFLSAVRDRLIARNAYMDANFRHELLRINESGVEYEDVVAEKIIFCSGINSLAPYFDWLPIRPLKGETLSITFNERPKVIYNKGVYVVPTSESGTYKAGATYSLTNLSPNCTVEGRQELEDKLSALLKNPYQVQKQEWGIRPTTIDRRPILGPHPEHSNLIIFNGLGTKGVSLAPYFSNQLANWLTQQGEIHKEVNINRFKPLYSRS